ADRGSRGSARRAGHAPGRGRRRPGTPARTSPRPRRGRAALPTGGPRWRPPWRGPRGCATAAPVRPCRASPSRSGWPARPGWTTPPGTGRVAGFRGTGGPPPPANGTRAARAPARWGEVLDREAKLDGHFGASLRHKFWHHYRGRGAASFIRYLRDEF